MDAKAFIGVLIFLGLLAVYKFTRCPKCWLRYSDATHDKEFCGIVSAALIQADQIKQRSGPITAPGTSLWHSTDQSVMR
jgi:hypothetical protein